MFAIKLIIAAAIIITCALVGVKKSKKYESREYILRESVALFRGIENEIKYMLSTLPNAIESSRQNMKTKLKDIMGSVGVELLKYNSSPAKISNEFSELTELTAYDRQIISSGIVSLGETDVEGQVGIINMTVSTLENQLTEAIEDKKKNSKLYRTVGIATGLMIAIIFI